MKWMNDSFGDPRGHFTQKNTGFLAGSVFGNSLSRIVTLLFFSRTRTALAQYADLRMAWWQDSAFVRKSDIFELILYKLPLMGIQKSLQKILNHYQPWPFWPHMTLHRVKWHPVTSLVRGLRGVDLGDGCALDTNHEKHGSGQVGSANRKSTPARRTTSRCTDFKWSWCDCRITRCQADVPSTKEPLLQDCIGDASAVEEAGETQRNNETVPKYVMKYCSKMSTDVNCLLQLSGVMQQMWRLGIFWDKT